MLLPKFLSRKKLSRKYRSVFASKIRPPTGFSPFILGWATGRIPRLPIRDCARGCNTDDCGQSRLIISAINTRVKTFFECLYWVLGLRKVAPWVNCPYAPTTPTVPFAIISRFQWIFFPWMAPHFFGHHDSPIILPSPGRVPGLPITDCARARV